MGKTPEPLQPNNDVSTSNRRGILQQTVRVVPLIALPFGETTQRLGRYAAVSGAEDAGALSGERYIKEGEYRFLINGNELPVCYWDGEGKQTNLDVQAMAQARAQAIANHEPVVAAIFENKTPVLDYDSTREHPAYDMPQSPVLDESELAEHGVRVFQAGVQLATAELLIHRQAFERGQLFEQYSKKGRFGLDIALVDAPGFNPIIFEHDPRYDPLKDRLEALKNYFDIEVRKRYETATDGPYQKNPQGQQVGRDLFESGANPEDFRKWFLREIKETLVRKRIQAQEYIGTKSTEAAMEADTVEQERQLWVLNRASNLELAKMIARIIPGIGGSYLPPDYSAGKDRSTIILCVGDNNIVYYNIAIFFNKLGKLRIDSSRTTFKYNTIQGDASPKSYFSRPDPATYKRIPGSTAGSKLHQFMSTGDPFFYLYHEGVHNLLHLRGNTGAVRTASPTDHQDEELADLKAVEMIGERRAGFVRSGFNGHADNVFGYRLPYSKQVIEI